MGEKCETCFYWREFTHNENCCHFLLIEHQMRGCDPQNCKRWRPRNRKQMHEQRRESLSKGMRGIL